MQPSRLRPVVPGGWGAVVGPRAVPTLDRPRETATMSAVAPLPMKHLPLILLAGAGAALAVLAFRAPEPSYSPPDVDAAPKVVPVRIVGEVPAGFRVAELAVTGMCCGGCTAKLYQRMTELDGVEAAAVDFDSSLASALVPEGFDVALLARALTFDEYIAEPVL